MRWSALLPLAAVACAGSPGAPGAPAHPTVDASAQLASAPAAATIATRGPVVVIDPDQVSLDDELVGSVSAIEQLGRMQKLDELFTQLEAHRESWKKEHPTEPFPGVATIDPHPQTPGIVLASTFQTMAYAGYPNIDVVVDGQIVATRARIPGPPCDGRVIPCPPPVAGHELHVQGDARSWRLVVFGDDELDEASSSPPSVERFAERLKEVVSARSIGEVTVHIPPQAPLSAMAPFLLASAEVNEGARTGEPLYLSILDISEASPRLTAPPETAEDRASPPTGHLSKASLKGVVRESFGELRHCYEQALMTHPAAQGRVVVRFEIGPDGRVRNAQAEADPTLPDEVGPCLEKVFLGLVFPAPEGGKVTVSYPAVFTPGG